MNNKDLFISGYLERIAKEYRQDSDPKKNLDLAFEIFSIASILTPVRDKRLKKM